ncbi:cI-like repressor, phage associated protein [Paucilactobacillus suebicus DSM 5007 = KCTC 3549]|uniref:CI-like repressor, phage associated protein n=2 Tax=Paucilactobacillus suebicus TaxID=152335 RepID=A0A0R1VTS7_9LACO|nr:cI-like repressor, phage associated protein [Paucilactobacillus suebicus DSM 5007 = KCTC 3549]
MEIKSGNVKSFSESIDLAYTTVRSILSRGVLNAKMENIIKICNGLGINPEDLIDIDGSIISQTTKKMILLNSDRQQNVYNCATHQLSEQNNNVVQLSDYTDNVEHTETVYGAVSAGTGQYLDHEQPEQVVVRGPAPEHDFAVKVVGNSMEPTFNDGQIVYVNRLVDENDVRNNQFVIAEVNGEAFIKKLSFNDDYVRLISLNPNYDDIIIHDYDDFLIRGIVVI